MKETLKFMTLPAIAGLLAALLILARWVFPKEGTDAPNQRHHESYAGAHNSAWPSAVNI